MLSTLKHFDGTGMSALLESLQPHCAQRVDFSLFSVNKGHVGPGPRYHPLEPAKQGFPGRNMKPREQNRKGQNPMLLGIAICWSPQA